MSPQIKSLGFSIKICQSSISVGSLAWKDLPLKRPTRTCILVNTSVKCYRYPIAILLITFTFYPFPLFLFFVFFINAIDFFVNRLCNTFWNSECIKKTWAAHQKERRNISVNIKMPSETRWCKQKSVLGRRLQDSEIQEVIKTTPRQRQRQRHRQRHDNDNDNDDDDND